MKLVKPVYFYVKIFQEVLLSFTFCFFFINQLIIKIPFFVQYPLNLLILKLMLKYQAVSKWTDYVIN